MKTIANHDDMTLASTGTHIEQSMAADIANLLDTNRRVTEILPIQKGSFLDRVFPDPVARAQQQGRVKIQQRETEYQLRAHAIVREAQARVLQTVLTHLLREGEAAAHARTASFVTDRQVELMGKVEQVVDVHQQNVIAAYARMEKLPTDFLREKELQRIHDSYSRLVDDVDTIMDQFSEIVRETIPATRD